MKNILILGGTQFVGRQLVQQLLENNANRIFLFNRGKTNPALFKGQVETIIGDRETADIEQIGGKEWDAIIDFSSYYPASLVRTLRQVNSSVGLYLYISSLSVYDFSRYEFNVPITEDFPLKTWQKEEETDSSGKTYGKRKVACEQILLEEVGLQSIILRPPIIYGAYDFTNRLYYWLYRIQKGKHFIVPDRGEHHLPLTYAGDLVRIICAALDSKLKAGIYNCPTHQGIALQELLQGMAQECQEPLQVCSVSKAWLKAEAIRPQHELPLWFGANILLSNAKLKQSMGFDFLSYRESIKPVYQYYQRIGWPIPEVGLSLEREEGLISKYMSQYQ